MKVLFGHHGQYGDLALNLPAISYLNKNSDWQVDMPIHKNYREVAPLFLNHPHLNSIIITDEYEKFPNETDRKVLSGKRYDKIFNPMAAPRIHNWWHYMHQASRVLHDYDLGVLPHENCQIELNQWFDVEKNRDTVAIAPFGGFYNVNNDKMLKIGRAQEIVNLLLAKGFKVLQIGGGGEPELEGTMFPKTNYFESIRAILGCKLFIHCDTGSGWFISGYKFPQLGLYSHAYYGKKYINAIQPVTPNGVFLSEENVNQISLDKIEQKVDNLTQ